MLNALIISPLIFSVTLSATLLMYASSWKLQKKDIKRTYRKKVQNKYIIPIVSSFG